MKIFLPILALLSTATTIHAVEIEWVTIGDAGNAPDKTGYGAVAYEFQIAKFETTVGQYVEFLNAVAANDPHGLWNTSMASGITDNVFLRESSPTPINRVGEAGKFRYEVIAGQEKKPVVYVSFLNAMRFVNWLHNGQGNADTETGAYDIAKQGGLALHKPGAEVWIATEDEWYKAAYFQPHSKGGPAGDYWIYPTRSNEQPVFRDSGAQEPNSANYSQEYPGNKPHTYADAFSVGSHPNSPSYYGTFDQGGNGWEWNEAIQFDSQRGMRGGSVAHTFEKMKSIVRSSAKPEKTYGDTGFRLARAVPNAGATAIIQPAPQPDTPKQP